MQLKRVERGRNLVSMLNDELLWRGGMKKEVRCTKGSQFKEKWQWDRKKKMKSREILWDRIDRTFWLSQQTKITEETNISVWMGVQLIKFDNPKDQAGLLEDRKIIGRQKEGKGSILGILNFWFQ